MLQEQDLTDNGQVLDLKLGVQNFGTLAARVLVILDHGEHGSIYVALTVEGAREVAQVLQGVADILDGKAPMPDEVMVAELS